MRAEPGIHLDHAATSWPKAPGVLDAVRRWFEEFGVDASRGDGPRCAAVAAEVARARSALARQCGVPPQRLAFTSGATESLNLFLRAFLSPGDRVVTTATEHSSVVRPLVALRDTLGLELEVVPCDHHGRVDPDDLSKAATNRPTRLVALCHASNVTGAIQDAAAIAAIAHREGARLLLDASQTAGVIDLCGIGADAIAASAHKGLLAPPGLGFLAVVPELQLRTVKQGGTGSSAAIERHPEEWPAAFEAGTPNSPAILGLAAAVDWLAARGDANEARRAALVMVDVLRSELAERLAHRVEFQSPATGEARLPILSFTTSTLDPAEAGIVLAEAGLHVRTGFHCAPWIHEALGTTASGTVRVSPGPFVTAADTMRVAAILAR